MSALAGCIRVRGLLSARLSPETHSISISRSDLWAVLAMSALGSVKRPMIDQGKSMLLSAASVLSRRDWLIAVGAAPLVSSSLSASGIEAESDAGWIDAHVHVWTP